MILTTAILREESTSAEQEAEPVGAPVETMSTPVAERENDEPRQS